MTIFFVAYFCTGFLHHVTKMQERNKMCFKYLIGKCFCVYTSYFENLEMCRWFKKYHHLMENINVFVLCKIVELGKKSRTLIILKKLAEPFTKINFSCKFYDTIIQIDSMFCVVFYLLT